MILRAGCRTRPLISSFNSSCSRAQIRRNSRTVDSPELSVKSTKQASTWLGGSLLVASLGIGYYVLGKFIVGSSFVVEPLSDTKFTPLKIVSTVPASQDAKLILLQVPPHLRPAESELAPIFSFYIKDTDIQVQRPYTPLDGIDNDGHIAFWVKKYSDGEVSRWLHQKNVGDELEIRGPIRTFDFKDGEYDDIVMISGGTGVTPFIQLLNHVFSRRTPTSQPLKTHYTLLHSSQSPAALPISDVLMNPLVYSVANRSSLTVRLFADFPTPGGEQMASNIDLQIRRIGKDDITRILHERGILARPQTWWEWVRGTKPPHSVRERKILFLVCGPEPMVAAFSGSRLPRRPKDQPVGGILGEFGLTPDQVKAF